MTNRAVPAIVPGSRPAPEEFLRGTSRTSGRASRPTDPSPDGSDDAEHDAQAQPDEASPHPRVSRPHEDASRTTHPRPPPPEGTPQAVGEQRAAGEKAATAVADGVSVTEGDAGERLPRDARLRSGRDIRRVLRHGHRRRTDPVDVFLADSPAGRPRLGVVVPLYGHTAVERNRLQRQLREIARREWLPGAWEEGRETDLLLRVRPAAYGAGFDALREAVLGALEESDRPAPGDR